MRRSPMVGDGAANAQAVLLFPSTQLNRIELEITLGKVAGR